MTDTSPNDLTTLLGAVREAGRSRELPYAGDIDPRDAWQLVNGGHAVLVDVRSAEELKFVGRVPGSVHIPWATGIALTANARFLEELQARVNPGDVVVFLCRSGKRSVSAATVATRAGFPDAYNILEGFEGDVDAHRHRGRLNGWRHRDLPWEQD